MMGTQLAPVVGGFVGLVAGPERPGGLALPYGRRILLLCCHVAGTGYVQLDHIEPELRTGDYLVLRREPMNAHDPMATLVLDGKRRKLGYVPRESNEVIARLMDAGKHITTELVGKGWDGSWLRLDIEVFLDEV